jgi:hypothetical protein
MRARIGADLLCQTHQRASRCELLALGSLVVLGADRCLLADCRSRPQSDVAALPISFYERKVYGESEK